MNELISVIIPVYNAEEYIEKCLRSIINQTYSNLEIIAVNDGSTDNSGKILSELAKEDERIIVIEQENCGVVTARNRGIETAAGKYVAFVDADDWIESDMYEKMLAEMQDSTDMVCTSYIFHWKNTETVCYEHVCGYKIYEKKDLDVLYDSIIKIEGKTGISGMVWNKLIVLDILKKVYRKVDPTIKWGEDGVLMYLYLLECKKIKIMDLKCYHYYRKENTASMKRDAYFLSDLSKVYICLYREFENNRHNKQLMPQLNRMICQALFYRLRDQKIITRTFFYPYFGKLDNKKIVLYGAGSVGQSFYRDIEEYEEDMVDVVLWADASPEKYKSAGGAEKGFTISSPDKIKEVEYDYIIIAVFEPEMRDQIICQLVDMGIDRKKILWQKTRELRVI